MFTWLTPHLLEFKYAFRKTCFETASFKSFVYNFFKRFQNFTEIKTKNGKN
jgi:hypothetical protein